MELILGSISKTVIKVLVNETFKCEAQSVFAEDPLPPTTMRLRRTGPRLHHPFYISFVLVSRRWKCFPHP